MTTSASHGGGLFAVLKIHSGYGPSACSRVSLPCSYFIFSEPLATDSPNFTITTAERKKHLEWNNKTEGLNKSTACGVFLHFARKSNVMWCVNETTEPADRWLIRFPHFLD